jgi:fumarylacetoacetase
MASWVPVPQVSDFSLHNLPYGIFSTVEGAGPQIGVAIGDAVLSLKVLAQDGVFEDLRFDTTTLEQPTLNAYAALGRTVHRQMRKFLQDLLEPDTRLGSVLRDNKDRRDMAIVSQRNVTMHLPMAIGDYTDFFVGYSHAVNVSNKSRIAFRRSNPK